ncbi:hypothetical protein [Bacillus toyonensis]|uniref:hypothetical protein n=1 Tax=Bacillus toyonensis TaxID=155322 RepID=UPI000BF18A62|nr:hypothetical protein [Bacillus toyonensis]PEM58616.1 hypothetical protein CN625_23445 [Bacillus toyonensis]
MKWKVVGLNDDASAIERIKKGDRVKMIDIQTNTEIECVVNRINNDSLTLTNKEAIKEIEIGGKQIPFTYGMVWLEDGDEVYSKEGIYRENDYYCCELESMEKINLLVDSIYNKVALPVKVTTKSDKVIECNFHCVSYSGGDDQTNEYELRQLQ